MPTSITSSGITFDDATTQTTSATKAGGIGTTQIANAAVTSEKLASSAVTPAKLSQPLTLATAQNTTSGTSIDFTGIPSWAKRITVMLNGVSLSGASFIRIQIGDGSVVTSGYSSIGVKTNSSATAQETSTSGFVIRNGSGASYSTRGHMILSGAGSNVWVSSHCGTTTDGSDNCAVVGGGSISLGGSLDRIRLTTVNGTDTFDAGSVNIMYEG